MIGYQLSRTSGATVAGMAVRVAIGCSPASRACSILHRDTVTSCLFNIVFSKFWSSDRAMVELVRRIALGGSAIPITGMNPSISVNVGGFLELQRAFERQQVTVLQLWGSKANEWIA